MPCHTTFLIIGLVPGRCLIISLLIFLMKDQVDNAGGAGSKAGFNSSMFHVKRMNVMRYFWQVLINLGHKGGQVFVWVLCLHKKLSEQPARLVNDIK